MTRLFVLMLALGCAPAVRPPPGVARVAGVCGGAIVGGRALTASHCVSDRETMLPVLSSTGLQSGDLSSLVDARGEDLAWIWLGYDPGPGLELGPPPAVGQPVRAWLASDGAWVDASVVELDRRWTRARLSITAHRGDSGSPVLDPDGRLVCIITGVAVESRRAECSWVSRVTASSVE